MTNNKDKGYNEDYNYEFDFEFTKGCYHYQKGGKKEELEASGARSGWKVEKYLNEEKIKKAEYN